MSYETGRVQMNLIKKIKKMWGVTPQPKETTAPVDSHRKETIDGEGNIVHIEKTIDYSVLIKVSEAVEFFPQRIIEFGPVNLSFAV